ncbi:hypothetical protein BDV96DRAFT_585541 [Lophiotrema nucula]|uniref:Acetyltransferase n=1 Tax=Lophiotrema nucula TaxID=690887 RepID=A0A6A5YTE8_9PLEO|nr:hypothetical protein BDV96DRAFT_585541 [Lophiotrema nucula]
MANLTLGKSLLALIGLATAIGPYIADWSKTHVLNPNWPPHARFHNGQTMSTGLFLGTLALYYLFLKPASPSTPTTTNEKSNANHALLFIHIYYLPSLSGILYPGALFVDPEFGEGKPQVYLFSFLLSVAWLGWWFESRRLSAITEGKKA